MTVIDTDEIKSALSRLGVRPSKGRGQNFLSSPDALSEILQFAAVSATEKVIEIGPGLGVLSADLFISSGAYCAVELEGNFAAYLRQAIPNLRPEQIINGDILQLTVPGVLEQGNNGAVPEGGAVIVSNVPYSISTGVVEWIIAQRSFVKRAALLLQREFAERIASSPGSRAFGSLSVFCQVFAACDLGPVISGESFFPPAEVESRLVELKMRKKPLIESDQDRFFAFVRSAFAKKRKTLLNNLFSANLFPGKAEAEQALRGLGIEPNVRAEALEIADFVRLFEATSKTGSSCG